MPVVKLPDGSERKYDSEVTVLDVANSIGAGLAKAALAGKVDDKIVDTSYLITEDADLAIIKDDSNEGLEVIRHSAAHLLAQAVKILYPTAQVTIGPVIENGFYYDFAYDETFSSESLEKIEKKMYELASQALPVTRKVMARDAAIEFFKSIGEHFKAEIIAEIPANEELSLYQQGDFIDLCRGPHVPSTDKIKAFKLTKVAGAYWRGDSNNSMLQRIYGTAWPNKKSLKQYLHKLEEAQKRDHRRLGKQLDLFHFQDIAPGMIFWHPKGWQLRLQVEKYIRQYTQSAGYHEINTPQLVDKVLWQKSGHWDTFRDNMFFTETENREYAIKPMSCPCHIQVYNQGIKSYRDLPYRLAEFGCCHRCEPSGSLHGMMRVRSMVQDDGHIFCTDEQLQTETVDFIKQVYQIYNDFGFDDIIIKIATRPEKRVGADAIWDKAEECLQNAVSALGIEYELNIGEGAFYGPKIEFSLRDCLDRVWQCGTLQVDFSMPERLGASYIAEDGSKQTPVMLHRAAIGTLERFIGILIEHYAGALPFWLAPVQLAVLNITDKHQEYALEVKTGLEKSGFRVIVDLRNEKMGYKIRENTMQKIPYLLVVGDKEVESKTVAVRDYHSQKLVTMSLPDLIAKLNTEESRYNTTKF